MQSVLNTAWDFESSELADLIDELPLWAAPFGLKLLDNIEYKLGIDILDIGFGTGFPLTEIAMRFGNTSTIYGIDPWEAVVERAKRKIEFYSIKNVNIIKGYAEEIPLQNHSMDLIISNNGLNNVNDINRVLKECSRILKTGGQFLHSLNLEGTMIEFYRVFEKTLSEFGLHNAINAMWQHIEQKRKPLEPYLQLIESHDFTVRSVIHDKFSYSFVNGTAFLNHFFIRLAFLESWKSIIPEENIYKVFIKLESNLNDMTKNGNPLILSIPFVVIDCTK